jgi:hypothetical protein
MSKLATILSAITLVSAENDGSCLLTLRSDLTTESSNAPSPDAMTWAERHKLLLAWTKEHAAVSAAATRAKEKSDRLYQRGGQPQGLMTGGELDMQEFIEQQKRSSDSCYSKHLEVKRTLDGLHQKVDLLANEITSNGAIIQAHAKITMDKNDEKTAADEKHERDLDECKNIRDTDQKEVDQFQKELDELTNIANPTVRSKIDFETDLTDEVKQHVEEMTKKWEAENEGHLSEEDHQRILAEALKGQGGAGDKAEGATCILSTDCASGLCDGGVCKESSLLQKSDTLVSINKTAALAAINKSFAEMNLTQCKKAVEFLQASSRVKSRLVSVETKDDCDQQRQQLQDEFANSFIQITQLRDSTEQRIADAHEDCVALADGSKDEAHERLDSTIQESTDSINRAQEILNALQPLWLDAKRGLKKVQEHMEELEDSCAKEDDVSEHLQRVRDLIMSLEKCPGRHDYQLQMPASAEEESE